MRIFMGILLAVLHEPEVHGYPGKLDITRTCGSWLSRKTGYKGFIQIKTKPHIVYPNLSTALKLNLSWY